MSLPFQIRLVQPVQKISHLPSLLLSSIVNPDVIPFRMLFPRILLLFTISALGIQWGAALSAEAPAAASDWLVDPTPYRATIRTNAAKNEITLANGLISRTIRISPNAATVALDNLVTGASVIRGVKPEATIEIDGKRFDIGGLTGQPNFAFLQPEWIETLHSVPSAFQFKSFATGIPGERLHWKPVRHHSADVSWPPKGVYLRLDFLPPAGFPSVSNLSVSVHYELYDGLPCYSKWITIQNQGGKEVRLDHFSSEWLAAVERFSEVDELSAGRTPPNLHIETDMSFGGMLASGANRRSYRWLPDPEYQTQVNYEKKTPCLLEVGPDLGPAQIIPPGKSFESYRAWIIPFENEDRERNGLAVRKMYRVIAPWTTENPLMMHVRYADEHTVTNAINQCAEVGFEMVILTFGSGFDLENESPATLKTAKAYAAYARSKGIEIGSYSLLASRSVGGGNDVVMPPGQTPAFGNSPCLESRWGTNYFRRLYDFHRDSGFMLLEHDGSYPGDVCASDSHPGHVGLADSRWNQWHLISDFYKWCRGEGIYLNVPDHYFLSGSTKTGMGYRESNWSLPREQQVIHVRQNIYDGTWQKLPSMGWMFVPLTEYQGGGEAATIEPLDQHLPHYERMLLSNLGLGVQACYRGPRLYDTDRTKAMVKKSVAWYKDHRDILESDLIHGRRADARDVDWMLHANPQLKEKGMLVVFNPLKKAVDKEIKVNLHYTGITNKVRVSREGAPATTLKLHPDETVQVRVQIPAEGMSWYVLQ